MNRLRFALLSMLLGVAFLSCVSTPKATETVVQPTPVASPVDSVASGAEAMDTKPDAAETAPLDAAEAAMEPLEDQAVPDLPPSERLLYFYPEPDPSFFEPPKAAPREEAPSVRTEPSQQAGKAKASLPGDKAKPSATEKPSAKTPERSAETSSGEKAKAEILPGIWEAEPTAPAIPAEKASAAPVATRQAPSRQATIPAGQTLEVWYPGNGWVFLGDALAQNGLGYENRKLDKADTLFTFKALKPGSYILDFSRYDVLADDFLEDSLAVTVTDEAAIRAARIRAPDYRATSKAAPADSLQASGTVGALGMSGKAVAAGGTASGVANTPEARISGSPQAPSAASGSIRGPSQGARPIAPARDPTAPMTDEPTLASPTQVSPVGTLQPSETSQDPAETLKKAQSALASGDASTALTLLDGFFMTAVASLDEGWFLRAQALESNGPSRDIRKALEAYQTLVNAYPDSPRWKAADERIRYIKQFYLKIR